MSEIDPKFEDPALKAAIRRACGNEAAPPHLRARITRALAVQDALETPIALKHRSWRNSPLVGLAAAALLLISFALIYEHFQSGPPRDLTLPTALADAMIVTYEQGAQGLEQNLLAAADPSSPDYNSLAGVLRNQLNHPVLATSLGPQWTLQAAGVTQVAGVPAAKLVFARGDETVNVFSIDGKRFYAAQDGMEYAQMVDGHPIAGFVRNGTVHCVVGGKDSSLNEMTKLRDEVRKSLI